MIRKMFASKREKLIAKDAKELKKQYYKKSILSYPPRHVTIAISSACMNRCLFCAYHSDDAKGISRVHNLHFRLSLEDFQRMVNMCYSGRVPKVHICATGEPFLHKDILSMIDYVIHVYGKVSFQTSFPKKIFDQKQYVKEIVKRQKNISYITTDLLSGDPKVHNHMKKGSSYYDVLELMEQISNESDIRFEAHVILTKYNYQGLKKLIDDLSARKINCHVAIVNLHYHGFNQCTSEKAVYTQKDTAITEALQLTQNRGDMAGIQVSIPTPSDLQKNECGAFWTRFQTWPVAGNDPQRYGENVIIGGCNAVVRGELNSLGYFFDYNNVMDLWNNEKIVQIRENLIKGVYPDKACCTCQNYQKKI